MDRAAWLQLLTRSLGAIEEWESRWPDVPLRPPSEADSRALQRLTERLTDGNYPFFHPQYAGQMIKPPHPVAWTAYATAMAMNPNNHALDGGPPTAHLEREAVAQIAEMFGFDEHLGHLSASGTIANLEALWVARELLGPHSIAVSQSAHYTHARMAQVLGLEIAPVAALPTGEMDMMALRAVLAAGQVKTIVATMGTTGIGAIDPLADIVQLAAEFGCRVHADAAYGGFFKLLADRTPALAPKRHFDALAAVDSIVVDPHKHGLQPYGCGCVVYADPSVGRVYKHESPYTYFTSAELHLGEITLECSRAGASAAALWTTLQALPLEPHAGLGDSLAAGRRAALAWAELIRSEPGLALLVEPQTDILCFAPMLAGTPKATAISAATEAVFRAGMVEGDDAFFLAKFRVSRSQAEALWPHVVWDAEEVVVLRSTLMKPEHEALVPRLHELVVAATIAL
ncbi:MAG: glutamate/tyrosine decarboxylase-like PLP-dependent enzyme [Bradymonadia bacterium]